MREQFQHHATIQVQGHNVCPAHATLYGQNAAFQVIFCQLWKVFLQHDFTRSVQFEFFKQLAAFVENTFNLRDENQLVSLHGARRAGGHVFHGQVERLARGGKANGGQQHNSVAVQTHLNGRYINFSNQPCVLQIHTFQNAHGAGGDEVARNNTHGRMCHGRVGQALRECSFDVQAQFARCLFCTFQRAFVGNSPALVKGGLNVAQSQLFLNLRAGTTHQHNAHAHGMQQRQILSQ